MTDRAQLPEDFFDAVEAVARELDSRRTLQERVRDAMRTAKLFFVISWHHLRGRGR
ncbi:MAG: hypothetical protein ACYC37_01960 [Desulfobacteria bacterium]